MKPIQLTQKIRITADQLNGPGTQLHEAIQKKFGEMPENTCNCKAHILLMNMWGVEGCIENIDAIVNWLHEEAVRRGWQRARLPLSRYFIKRFVLKAIKEK